MFIYEFGFSDPECSWSRYFKHEMKYTEGEIKKIIEDITGNYRLLIALYVLNEFEEFPWMKKHYTFEEGYDSYLYDQCLKKYDGNIEINDMLFNKADVYENFTKEVIQVLESEAYGFKYYKVPLEASVYLRW